jgi:hypothetical protein
MKEWMLIIMHSAQIHHDWWLDFQTTSDKQNIFSHTAVGNWRQSGCYARHVLWPWCFNYFTEQRGCWKWKVRHACLHNSHEQESQQKTSKILFSFWIFNDNIPSSHFHSCKFVQGLLFRSRRGLLCRWISVHEQWGLLILEWILVWSFFGWKLRALQGHQKAHCMEDISICRYAALKSCKILCWLIFW